MKTKTPDKALSWKPILDGPIFCSPGCGAHCTKAAYDEALQKASDLARLMGPGWEPHVWENMGWFYKVISPCGRIKLYAPAYAGSEYTAYLGTVDGSGEPIGENNWSISHEDPKHAVAGVIELAKSEVEYLQDLIANL